MRSAHALVLGLMLDPTSRSVVDEPAEIWEVDRTTTAGTVIVAASPTAIYERATDYDDWTEVFSDVKKVTWLEGGREDALVRFKSRALERTVTVRFANTPDERIVFTLVDGPPGAVSTGRFELTANGDGTTTLSAELMMDVTGAPGLLISDAKIRKMRRNKLRADLDDLSADFAR